MRTNKLILIFFFTAMAFHVSGQERLKHAIGTTYHFVNINNVSQLGFFGLEYTPRFLILDLADELALNASAPIAVSFQLTSNPDFNYYLVNIPISIEFAIGHDANYIAEFPIGVFLGGGADYTYIGARGLSVNNFAPIVSLGLRASVSSTTYNLRLHKALSVPVDGQTLRVSLSSTF